ncbi:MAG TPA: hypothetical protein VF552_13555 [Allosphingosinicella sp.]|jgi:hypothetical protein
MSGALPEDEGGQVVPALVAAAVTPAALGTIVIPALLAADGFLLGSLFDLETMKAVAAILAFTFVGGLAIAFGHVLLLGYPLYRMLRPGGPIGWLKAALAGFVIGSIPLPLLLASPASGGGRLDFILLFGLLGLSGGLAFRRTLYRSF